MARARRHTHKVQIATMKMTSQQIAQMAKRAIDETETDTAEKNKYPGTQILIASVRTKSNVPIAIILITVASYRPERWQTMGGRVKQAN